MERTKAFFMKNFESLLVVLLLVTVSAIHFGFQNKFAFLNFYYLPILVAGYYLGKRLAILVALASVLTVTLFTLIWPGYVLQGLPAGEVFWPLFVWGCFLLLAATLVGTLYEEKEKNIVGLKLAYVGVLEILSKYLESGDPYTKNHSVRVAQLAVQIGRRMNLAGDDLENIRVAGLLHDIGKVEVSLDLINKSVSLTEQERDMVNAHSQRGAKLLELAGSVLKQAVPLVEAHHQFFCDLVEARSAPLGARIIAVADAYDAMISDRPYRDALPQQRAIEEIKSQSGRQFDPEVVDAFLALMAAGEEEPSLYEGPDRRRSASLTFPAIPS
ncbi:MAG: HD domain-containing protein [Actinomycetota bacterium]|nr:HD domain-containing protein [Actinomycetota bacterium]